MSNGPVTQAEIEAIREEWAKDLEILDATPGLTGIEDSATAVATLLRAIDERDYTMCDLNAIADSKESIEDDLRLEIADLRHQLASRNNDVLSLQVQREQLRQEISRLTSTVVWSLEHGACLGLLGRISSYDDKTEKHKCGLVPDQILATMLDAVAALRVKGEA